MAGQSITERACVGQDCCSVVPITVGGEKELVGRLVVQLAWQARQLPFGSECRAQGFT